MSKQEKWKELETGNVIKLEEGQRAEGRFIKIEESQKYKDSYAVTIEVKGEEQPSVLFVNNIVKDLLETNKVSLGQNIAILFVGMKENQSKTFKYKKYKLFVEG